MNARSYNLLVLALAAPQLIWGGSGSISLYLLNTQLDTNILRATNNIAYYGTYQVGTPPIQYTACFDTGSGDTWLPSTLCSSAACSAHQEVNTAASSSLKVTSSPFQTQYGTGAVAGIIGYDNFILAGINITNQGFGLATSLSSQFAQTSCDGLMGLGFQSLMAQAFINQNVLPPFLQMVTNGILDQPLFTLWLSPDPGAEPAGELTFGEIDSSKYSGAISYLNVVRESYWSVALDSVKVNNQTAAVSATYAIIDSGTTAVVLSTSDAAAINQQIPGAAFWAAQAAWNVSCNVASLPTVTFVMSGQSFQLPPQLYVQELADASGNALGVCSSAIVGGGSSGVVVLGTNFLRAYYAIFQVNGSTGTAQVGLAPSTGASTSVGGR